MTQQKPNNPSKKSCPVLLRNKCGRIQILIFKHPLAGFQLVKGTIEAGESPSDAAVREMKEESGIDVKVTKDLGWIEMPWIEQSWNVFLVDSKNRVLNRWRQAVEDGGGLIYDFSWRDLSEDYAGDTAWDRRYVAIIDFIRNAVSGD